MAKRSIASAWARAFNRSAKKRLRQTLKTIAPLARQARARSGAAVVQAVQAAAQHTRFPAAAGDWLPGVAVGAAGLRRFHLYRPAALKGVRAALQQRVPLVVMLHGCGQNGRAMALSSRMHRLADRHGFLVLYPDQDTLAHPQGCWRWYDTRSGHAQAEARTLQSMIDQVCLRYPADRSRVALAGLSAGAGMAALMATLAPGRCAAVVMHSGVAPGSAQSTATALQAMRGRGRVALPDEAPLPPLLVLHGTADGIVSPDSGRLAAQAWAHALGALPSTPRRVQRGARHAMNVTDYRCRRKVVVRLCEIEGLGHAWSGGDRQQAYSDPAGPDASRLAWAFMQAAFEHVP
ncbi:PHB depolymerase family esterase [Aquincola sp. MAHUQ-54]|uniref:PHB depolymerase family esterase n=1 Tax=Aquincola agrisoli TaxID=3119538 RepID=A0AAW9Q9R1_9BURK